MPDTGDPRFAAPIWEGRFELTPSEGVTFANQTVMLSKSLDVQFTSDAEGVVAGSVLATLPSECRPLDEIHLPVVVEAISTDSPRVVSVDLDAEGVPTVAYDYGTVTASGPTLGILSVSPIGEITCNLSGTVRLSGFSFNLCGNYY